MNMNFTEGSMMVKDGTRMNVSEWAGGFTKEFAKCILRGATSLSVNNYPTHFIYARDKNGPEEEHEASSVECEHEHGGDDEDMQHVEAIAEETCVSPADEEAIRDDAGNWSDDEIPRPHRTDTL